MRSLCLLAGLLVLVDPVFAQGTRADYERAQSLARRTENKISRQNVRARWLPGNTSFWYRVDLAEGAREFLFVDALKGERRPAFDHARLAAGLARAATQEVAAAKLPLDALAFAEDSIRFNAFGKRWRCVLADYAVTATTGETNATTGLPREPRARPSRRTGAESSITFVNGTTDDAEIFWIDPDGERRGYGRLRAGERREFHTFAGHVWLAADRAGRTLAVFEARADGGEAILGEGSSPAPRRREETPASREKSPDGHWQALIKDHNVHLKNLDDGETVSLSSDGTADDPYENRFHWSPDSRRLVVLQVRKGEERKIHFVESSPKDQLQPRLHTLEYAKPGDRLPLPRPRLFDVPNQRQITVPDALFTNAWSISELRWRPDSSRFTFLYNQRGHQILRVVSVDAAGGAARPIIEETSRTFIDYSGKLFHRDLPASGEILWMSERDGWCHLWLYDAETGAVKNQITRGPWVVRGVERVDAERRQIWFRAGGIRPEQDPYHVHLARVNFDGSGLRVLTAGDGTHKWEFSPDEAFFLDTWSRVDQPPVTELRRSADGALVCELERADASALTTAGWTMPERFTAKGRDGATDIFGIIIKPSTFDPAKKYPVIEEIYAGPHGAHVPKEFGRQNRQHALAELGFIIVQMDGMGTSQRSKAFHDVCWKNLGDAGFPDRIAWLRAAAITRPWLDLARVGIYGGSAGGQSSTRALLDHGDFYRVAVSDCGCHDNRMDKVWWNEQWHGWPVDESYVKSSNVADAHKLQGKLLLIVGELDRNVDPASTMQVANALIKADKDFDLLIVPGGGHGIAESPYGTRRRMDHFVRNLWGAEPRR